MTTIFNEDFLEFIRCLNHHEVEYIVVGGYSVILHGYTRTTGDLDLWIEKEGENYQKLVDAFHEFNMPVFDMTKENFLNNDKIDVFTFGRSPVAIDIMTSVKGLEFKDCFKNAPVYDLEGLAIRFLHINDLLSAKKATNRPKDQDDIEHLNRK